MGMLENISYTSRRQFTQESARRQAGAGGAALDFAGASV